METNIDEVVVGLNYGAPYSPEEVAAYYAVDEFDANYDFREQIEAHFDALVAAGAKFDYQAAFALAYDLVPEITITWNPDSLVDGSGWDSIDKDATISAYEKLWVKCFYDSCTIGKYRFAFAHANAQSWTISGDYQDADYDTLMADGQHGGEDVFSLGDFWVNL